MLDRFILWLVRARLARFRRLGDAADVLADKLLALCRAEIERRNQFCANWRRELDARDRSMYERHARELAQANFEGLGRTHRPNVQ